MDPQVRAGPGTIEVADERIFRLSTRGKDDKPAEAAVPTPAEQTILMVEQLPREAGWLLISAGVVGMAVPGVLGTPFLLAGAVVLTPGGPRLLSRWIPSKLVHTAMRQVSRFLDDIERRYPRSRPPRLEDNTSRPSEAR